MLTDEERKINGRKGFEARILNKQKRIQERKKQNEQIYKLTQYILKDTSDSTSNRISH